MNYGIISHEQLEKIDQMLKQDLIEIGVACAILVDMAGNTITMADNGQVDFNTYSFAALAAGNYASVEAMAKLVGETEFSLLFHKGENSSINFTKVNDDFLLITTFGKDVSLGYLRLKVAEVVEQINSVCQVEKKPEQQSA